MKFLIYAVSLFFICKTSFYMVIGQTVNGEINDCTKLYNYLYGDSKEYDKNSCCNESGIECDNEGYITNIDK